jgi:hypothetical protein
MVLNALRLLSGISGETLAQILKPTETAVLRARAMYEDSLVRALQLGLSYGVLYSMWNLGTGMGTPDAAERAYDDGQGPEAFAFEEREALPLTPMAAINAAKAKSAERDANLAAAAQADGILPRKMIYTDILGYDDAEAQRMIDEQAQVDVVPNSADGTDQTNTTGQGA